MENILHISYDLRDRSGKEVTSAVKDLISVSASLTDISVVDVVRVSARRQREMLYLGQPPTVQIDSPGLPLALMWHRHLKKTIDAVLRPRSRAHLNLESAGIIHSHKLSYEGVIGDAVCRFIQGPDAKHAGEGNETRKVKHFISLRQTDFYVCRARPDIRWRCRKVLKNADGIFYIMPYMVGEARRIFGGRFFDRHLSAKMHFLPNIVNTRSTGNAVCEEHRDSARILLTVLRMTRGSVRRKNVKRLLRAFSKASMNINMNKNMDKPDGHIDKHKLDGNTLDGHSPDGYRLVVVGGGNHLPRVRKWTHRMGLGERVVFRGRVEHSRIDEHFRKAAGFVLPSKSETFGLVYAEALLNETPILYARRTGFDGMFDGVGVMVDPRSVSDIARGLEELVSNSDVFRKNIRTLKNAGGLEIFSRQSIAQKYTSALRGET
jgi:glycosyltransferase involved in cell wall biosynthesis